jgi:hypothetical protein
MSVKVLQRLALVLGVFVALGCSDTETTTSAPPVVTTTAEAHLCDAGDEAFVKRVIPLMWGRKAGSIREVAVLLQILQGSDRPTLIQRMARSPEYLQRWWYFFQDALAVNRASKRSNALCYQTPLLPMVTPDLAIHVRDSDPNDTSYASPWNMADVMLSALMLDDLSPLYLAELFGQQGTVVVPLDEPYEEHVNRKNYAAIFQKSYLHRRMECMACHNSNFSVTGSDDPALDRTWEIPGYFEQAIFGDHTGRAVEDLRPFFRSGGLLTLEEIPHEEGPSEWNLAPGRAPWGIAMDCGHYVDENSIETDPLEATGFFINDYGDTANIWHLEASLREGFDALRDGTLDAPDPSAPLELDGAESFAHLVSVNIADQVWEEATGARLTIGNYFPRNQEQRDILMGLTQALVDNEFSLVALLVATTTHPLFNQAPPAVCDADTAYPLPPVFDPYTVDYDDPSLRGNGVGDTVRRLPTRTLVWSVTHAMRWTPVPDFFGFGEGYKLPPAGAFLRDIGAYLKDTSTGFSGIDFRSALAWETAYGACTDPKLEGDQGPIAHDESDWVTQIVSQATDAHTLEDGVRALKDRLLTDPTLDAPEERSLLEALIGVPLNTPITNNPGAKTALRRACAAFVASPQFLLEGDAGPDRVGTAAGLVVTGTSFEDYCKGMESVLFEPGELSCGEDALTLTLQLD